MQTAIYPGSFDPVTNGHLDIIERARRLFDHLIVAIAHNSSKKCLFSVEERAKLLAEILKDMPNVEVRTFSMLLVDFVRQEKACTIIRGLRAVSDFDYEYAMYQANAEMCPEVDTIFLLASREYSFLSSGIIKEFARYGQQLNKYTPEVVSKALLKKISEVVKSFPIFLRELL